MYNVEQHEFFDRVIITPKNMPSCIEFKKNGNKCFVERDYHNALINYNKALCWAENRSEVAGLLYGNRSAVALEMKSYPECLKNIQLAREHNLPQQSLSRLIKREEMCKEMMSTTVSLEDEHDGLVNLMFGSNPIEPSMIDCLKIEHNKNGTPCLITTKDLKTGDLIAVQKPFSGIIMDNYSYIICLNCLNECVLDLIPCYGCSSVMFCSKNCAELAFEVHQYECEIIGFLKYKFGSDELIHLSKCRALFKALSLFNGSANEMKKYLEGKEEASGKLTLNVYDICKNEKAFFKAVYNIEDSSDVELLEDFLSFFPKMRQIMSDPEMRNFIISFTSKMNKTLVKGEKFEKGEFGGYYPMQTVLNISCAPNVISSGLKDSRIVYIAQNPIKAGEKLTIGTENILTYSVKSKLDRQREIFYNFQLKCDCVARVKNYPMLSQQKFTSQSLVNDASFRRIRAKHVNGIIAVKMYKENCEYIDEHFDESPCKEITLTVFTNSQLLRRTNLFKKN